MQGAVGIGHAFDGADMGAVRLHGEHGARLHRLAIEVDRAGAAMAGVAADMGSGEVQLLAQEVDQQGTRLGQCVYGRAVHRQGDLGFRHGIPPHARARLGRARARAPTSRLPSWCDIARVPRWSEAGEVIASAAATARLTFAASSLEPTRMFTASSAHSGVSATLVRPIEQLATAPPPFKVNTTAAAAVGVVADLALELLVGVAVPGGRYRDADCGEDLARFQRGEIGALIEFACRNAAIAALAGDVIDRARGTASRPACHCRDSNTSVRRAAA